VGIGRLDLSAAVLYGNKALNCFGTEQLHFSKASLILAGQVKKTTTIYFDKTIPSILQADSFICMQILSWDDNLKSLFKIHDMDPKLHMYF
jgi:hypothetical protein